MCAAQPACGRFNRLSVRPARCWNARRWPGTLRDKRPCETRLSYHTSPVSVKLRSSRGAASPTAPAGLDHGRSRRNCQTSREGKPIPSGPTRLICDDSLNTCLSPSGCGSGTAKGEQPPGSVASVAPGEVTCVAIRRDSIERVGRWPRSRESDAIAGAQGFGIPEAGHDITTVGCPWHTHEPVHTNRY
jgi:hypothetical protein